MRKYYLYLSVALTLGVVGCDKDDSGNPSGGNSANFPLFSGYTATDNSGVPMGLNDPTDWRHDTTWLTCEENLFPQLQNLTSNFEPYPTIQIYPAFPNPTFSASYFQLSKEADVRLSFRLVNKNFNVLASSDSIYTNTFGINTQGVVSSIDTMVRIYYFFERNDSCLYKGHGDLKIN